MNAPASFLSTLLLANLLSRLGGVWPDGFALAGLRSHSPPPAAAPTPGIMSPQLTDSHELQHYASVRTVVDWSPAELLRALPELKGLQPAPSQKDLALILHGVGEKVEANFRDFLNTTSLEQITQERTARGGGIGEVRNQKFRYVVLARPEKGGVVVDEYRTDTKGRLVDLGGMQGDALITNGFVSASNHFHPFYQSGSVFRYLGWQVVGGRNTYVIAFAQRPETARLLGRVNAPGGSAVVLSQGVAWIDPSSYRIIRLRTDLLAPRPDIFLQRQTTEIRFTEVRFTSVPATLWLPREVAVTMKWRDETFHNLHRYSDFKLFRVETEEKREAPQPTPHVPSNPDCLP